jgi:hypothetical protein
MATLPKVLINRADYQIGGGVALRLRTQEVFKARLNGDVHVLKLIIEASCAADRKTRSRWGQALRYVWRRSKRRTMSREEFDAFLHCHGGVLGCAAKLAVPKIKPDQFRLGSGFVCGC